jgi:sugar phosphate permease
MKFDSLRASLLNVIILSMVIISVVSFTIQNRVLIGPVLIALGFLPWIPLTISGRKINTVAADIVFGTIDTGILGIAALIGASFAGVLGAIVGGAAGDAITDAFAGLFEGKVAEVLKRRGIEQARTPLGSSMGKMSGCLFGIGIVLTIAWSLIK